RVGAAGRIGLANAIPQRVRPAVVQVQHRERRWGNAVFEATDKQAGSELSGPGLLSRTAGTKRAYSFMAECGSKIPKNFCSKIRGQIDWQDFGAGHLAVKVERRSRSQERQSECEEVRAVDNAIAVESNSFRNNKKSSR